MLILYQGNQCMSTLKTKKLEKQERMCYGNIALPTKKESPQLGIEG